MRESVEDVVKDLTGRLSTIAHEFRERIERASAVNPATRHDDAMLQDVARRLLAERRGRSRHLPAELFHEPAWDMLLALFVSFHEGRTITVGALVTFSDAPATTSQRWIEHLHRLALVTRHGDPNDRRRIEITLSEKGREAITRYLQQLPPN